MNQPKRLRRWLWALLLSLTVYAGGVALGQDPSAFALVMYAGSGRHPTAPTETAATEDPIPPATERTQPTVPAATEPEAVVSFSGAELEAIGISCLSGVSLDAQALLGMPLEWELTGESPTVLIVHTHTTEGYADTYDRVNFRTRAETGNMLAIGDEVARVLALNGITVIHDRTVHDDPDYSNAYSAARTTVEGYLEQYPSICLVLDLHRDALSGDTPLVTAATVNGQSSAQLMLVMGSGYEGWEDNFSLALKLTVLLERENPGITRAVSLRNKVYNQDLCPGSLLVEVGGSGNTLQEALIAANALAQAIVKLAHGTAATEGP